MMNEATKAQLITAAKEVALEIIVMVADKVATAARSMKEQKVV